MSEVKLGTLGLKKKPSGKATGKVVATPITPTTAKGPRVKGVPRAPGNRRRKSRELVLQGLYQWQVATAELVDIETQFAQDDEYHHADPALFQTFLRAIVRQATELDLALEPHLDRKPTELSPIERAILLLGAHELINTPQTPYRVIINEAVELAKSYGGTDGHKYVNGVLDKLAALVRAADIAFAAEQKKNQSASNHAASQQS
jgi:transcription antitermination protein NusB